MILIKNGTVIDPENNLEQLAEVLIKDGKIVKIAQEILEEDIPVSYTHLRAHET